MPCYYSVNNQFHLCGKLVPSQKILPIHQEILDSSLRNYILKLSEANDYIASRLRSEEKVDFDFAIGQKGAVFQTDDSQQAFAPNKAANDELNQITRVARYYQNLGYVPRDLSKDRKLNRSAEGTVKKLRKAATPGTDDKVYTVVRVGENSLGLARDIFNVAPDVGQTSFLNYSGYAAGSIWSFFALKEVMNGITDYEKAHFIGDKEGARRAGARMASGLTTLSASTLFISGKILSLGAGFETAATAFGFSSNALFGLGSILGMGIAGLGMLRCHRFTSRIDEYLDNPDPDLTEAQKLKGALRFLKDAMSVTPEERAELTRKIRLENRDKTPEERKALFDTEINHLTETKVKYMKRRTSNKGLALMLDYKMGIDALLPLLDIGGGIEEAKTLIADIKTENLKKKALYAISFFAAFIGLLAVITGTVLTGGALPFILLGISATISIVLGSYNIYQYCTRTDTDIPDGINLQPLDSAPRDLL